MYGNTITVIDAVMVNMLTSSMVNHGFKPSVIWYFEPHGILTPGSIFIHGILNPLYGKLNPQGILNPLISNQEMGKGSIIHG